MERKLNEIIGIQAGFKAAVDILQDLDNKDKIRGYIPTENGVKVIQQVFGYLKPHISTRPIILTGTYGTGKSHLGLVIASLLRRKEEDELCENLFAKIESKWPDLAEKIKMNKKSYGEKPYLLVYLEAEKVDWGSGFFDNSLILALKETLKREGLEDITPKTAYDRALERIREMERDFYDAYKQLKSEVANKGYYSVKHIEHKLSMHIKDALKDFANIHKKVSAGAGFDMFWGVSASDAYISTVEVLKKKDYKGILLIWDEFTPVLRKLVENPESGEALAFQKFAQTCETAGANKIVSIFISIRNIQDMIDRVVIGRFRGESLRIEAEKISARFRVMQLGRIDKETYYLMKGVISHKEAFNSVTKSHNEQLSNIRNEVDELNLFHEYSLLRDDIRVIVEDLYPLHPLTTLALSRLTDRVGQRERTIFTFLCDMGEGTFRDFLENEKITEKSLPLIYPFELVSYFLPLIRQSRDYKELSGLSRKYEEIINMLSHEDEISRKIIQTIFILNASAILSTTEHIFFGLGCFAKSHKKAVINKLGFLKEEKKIAERLLDKSWRFFGQMLDVPIDDIINELMSEIFTKYSPKELFNDAVKQIRFRETYRIIRAENYNIDKGTDRKVELKFIVSRELDNPDSLRKKVEEEYLDGAYYFVLADTEEDLSMAKKRIREYFSEDTNLLFALPIYVYYYQKITPYLGRLKALEKLPQEHPQYRSELREELNIEEEDVKQYLKKEFNEFLDPLKEHMEFYYKGEKREIKGVNKLKEFVSEMMENTFPNTPPIAREELIKEEGRDTWRNRYRIPLIDNVLSPKASSLLSQETGAVKKHIIMVIYKDQNVLRLIRGEWVIGKPTSSPSNNAMVKIWEEIENFIRSASTYKELSELIKRLRLPPYGLKERTIGLVLAPVFREYVLHNNLILEWKGQPVDKVDGELLEEIVQFGSIKIKFQEISQKHKIIWYAIADIFESAETDLESVFRAVVNWWRGLPLYSRNTIKISQQAKRLKESFFEPLSTLEKDKSELFNTVLPSLIEIEDLSRKTDQEVEKTTKESLSNIKKEFDIIISKLHEMIKTAVTDVLGNEETLLSYYSKLPGATREHIFGGNVKNLMEWLKTISSKKKLKLDDFIVLAEEILTKCENWNDDQVIRLKGHLESGKNLIDSYTPPPTLIKEGEESQLPPGKMRFRVGDISRVFTLYENLEDAPNKEQVNILLNILKDGLLSALNNGQITGDEFLSIIYHIIKGFENA